MGPGERWPQACPGELSSSAFTSIPWRESWKYGERAFRYLHTNLGHALAATSFASAALGWRATLLDGVGTEDLALMLGLGEADTRSSEAEAEIPDCIVAIHPQGSVVSGFDLSEEVLAEFREVEWEGRPDRLSPSTVDWPLVAEMTKSTAKPRGGVAAQAPSETRRETSRFSYPPTSLRKIVRQRRSAVVMDPAFSMTKDDFFRAMSRTIPGPGRFPFNLFSWRPQVHLAVFVHRVLGLDRGLYLLVRNPDHEESLRSSMRQEFDWKMPGEALPGFYRLETGDFRDLARTLSCGQKIASDGCFSLAMIARFRSALAERGPWFYNRLFWECGMVGQTLYLEAEAAGLRGCGVGCYFDDPVSSALGLAGPDYQSLYHFAVGRETPLLRMETLPAYPAPD